MNEGLASVVAAVETCGENEGTDDACPEASNASCLMLEVGEGAGTVMVAM